MTVRPGKKFGFQSAAENLQRQRRRSEISPKLHIKIETDFQTFFHNRKIAENNMLHALFHIPVEKNNIFS